MQFIPCAATASLVVMFVKGHDNMLPSLPTGDAEGFAQPQETFLMELFPCSHWTQWRTCGVQKRKEEIKKNLECVLESLGGCAQWKQHWILPTIPKCKVFLPIALPIIAGSSYCIHKLLQDQFSLEKCSYHRAQGSARCVGGEPSYDIWKILGKQWQHADQGARIDKLGWQWLA